MTLPPLDAVATGCGDPHCWYSVCPHEGELAGGLRGITDMDAAPIPAPDGHLWLFATAGRTLAHLTSGEAFDMTSRCGRWFRHGYTKGERDASEKPCRRCLPHSPLLADNAHTDGAS